MAALHDADDGVAVGACGGYVGARVGAAEGMSVPLNPVVIPVNAVPVLRIVVV